MFRIISPLSRDRAYSEIEFKELADNELNGSVNSLNYDNLAIISILKENSKITAE